MKWVYLISCLVVVISVVQGHIQHTKKNTQHPSVKDDLNGSNENELIKKWKENRAKIAYHYIVNYNKGRSGHRNRRGTPLLVARSSAHPDLPTDDKGDLDLSRGHSVQALGRALLQLMSNGKLHTAGLEAADATSTTKKPKNSKSKGKGSPKPDASVCLEENEVGCTFGSFEKTACCEGFYCKNDPENGEIKCIASPTTTTTSAPESTAAPEE